MERNCPYCGWPVGESGPWCASAHRTSTGVVRYLRCVCGAWLVVRGGEIRAALAGAGATG